MMASTETKAKQKPLEEMRADAHSIKEDNIKEEEDEEEDEEDLEYDSASPDGVEEDISLSVESSSKRDDKNNNKSSSTKSKKAKRLGVKRTYGLRPRTQLRRPSYDCEAEDKEHHGQPQRKEPRSKVRGSLMAKYRRLTANARERQRMKEINDAFSTLQGILPALQGRSSASATGGASSRTSMTKIRTLRHAASYIQALSDLLSGGEPTAPLTFHKDFQTYSSVSHSNVSGDQQATPNQEIFCGLQQQTLSKGHVLRGPEVGADSFKATFVTNTERNQVENQPPSGVERSLSWEDVHTTDEELFSLLEKEVQSMRNSSNLHQGEGNQTALGDLSWNEEFVSMGCK